MNNFRKIGEDWGIAADEMLVPGSIVDVTLKNGSTKKATVGAFCSTQYGKHVFRIAAEAHAQATKVGDLSGILALFAKAAKHLKHPAVELGVPALGADFVIRINVAGERARVPGSLTVVGAKDAEANGKRPWYGRVLVDGTYEPSQNSAPAISERLRAFACDPAGVASEHGRLTGRCCFCRLALTDARSTAVGYGETCAAHYGLPWGRGIGVNVLATEGDDLERRMHEMEAAGDREQTLRDESAKHAARCAMEAVR